MNKVSKQCLVALILLLAVSHNTWSQRLDYEDKLFFADSVQKIKVWTYIEGDTSYRSYQDAIRSAAQTLNRKGYIADILEYKTGQGLTPQAWMQKIISGLKKNEAFLEIPTRIVSEDAVITQGPNMKTVTNTKGAVMISLNTPQLTDSVQKNTSCMASSRLYVNWQVRDRNALVPVYSRKQSLESGDIYPAVKFTLGGIPSSKHPVVILSSSSKNQGDFPVEIILSGGYTFPSKMNITEGSGGNYPGVATFAGNVQYGLELGLPLSRNIDIFLKYQRLGTFVKMNTPVWGEAGSLTINHNYILSGINFNFRVNRTLSPFAGVTLGTLNIVPNGTDLRDYWYFILGAQGGMKVYLSRWFGLRFQAEILYQLHTDRAPFLFSDNQTDIPVDARSNMIQAGISAGVIFRLGNR